MALKWQRAGAAAGVGVIVSGADYMRPQGITQGGRTIRTGTVAAVLGVLAGVGLQYFQPYTMPDLVDGLTDGSLAIVAERGTAYGLHQTRAPGYSGNYPQAAPFAAPQGFLGPGSGYPSGRPAASPLVSPVAQNLRGKLQ